MSATHSTSKTPNPSERSLVVTVSEASFASAAGKLPKEGTLYGSSEWKTFFGADYRKEFSDFVYLGQGDDSQHSGQLVFSMNKTVEEASTPFRTVIECKNHRWPPVLKRLIPVPVSGFPLSTQTTNGTALGTSFATRYRMIEFYIPEVVEGTKFITDYFTGPRPFAIPQHQVPLPTSVSYDLINLRGGFPECLHKKIDFGELLGTTNSQYGATVSNDYQVLQNQVFPATNFVDWEPYVLSDTQEFIGSCYYRTRVRVFPPEQPPAIRRIS